jgi:D-beta-D-heptose 7-phosphate kinase/D-beta-D-heptose 1-phosphate adenosyltransferase
MKIVAVSGGFDPPHIGHVRMFNDARKLGDKLVVIINNENWLRKKKGFVFMPDADRKEIIQNFKSVDHVIVTEHPVDPSDMSVCEALKTLKPDIFANGGDRHADNIPEYELCDSLGIEMVFNVGGDKLRSSSELVKNAQDAAKKRL